MKKAMATLTFLAVLTLAGCGSVTPSADVTPAATVASTEKAESSLKLIGEKSDAENVFDVVLANKTQKDIDSFTVKSGADDKYPANMLKQDDSFAVNESRLLYYAPTSTEDHALGNNGALANEEYTIKITFSDKKSAELHQFPFKDADTTEIFLDGDTAYIEYTSKFTGKKVSTKEAEKMIASTVAAETTTEAATESTTEEETVYTEPSYDEPVYTEPAPTYVEPATTQAPVYTEPPTQVPAPTEVPTEAPTGCGDNFLFN
jgi:hypothetical protein